MYPIHIVPDNAYDLLEQLGTKRKFWFEDATGTPTLYKEGRPNTGENWAEKVCCEIALALGLPHAQYDLAVWRGTKGVVSRSFVPVGGRLVLGNELLGAWVPGYQKETRYQARQHMLGRVMVLIGRQGVTFPLGFDSPPDLVKASDVFVG